MKPIKACIIGTGFVGLAHIEAVRRLGFVEVAALVEPDAKSAEAHARELGIPRWYTHYEEMLQDREIQVVHNCTPNHLHFPINREVILAGKHILSEKPLAISTQETRELLRLARENKVVHGVNFNYRQYPIIKQLAYMVQNGDLGKVHLLHGSYLQDWLLLETDYNWRLDPAVGGESRAVADIGSHWCDTVQYVTGQKITRVCADLATVLPVRIKPAQKKDTYERQAAAGEDTPEAEEAGEPVAVSTEDYASVLLQFDGGGKGAFTVSQVSAGRKNRLTFELAGSLKSAFWNQEEPEKLWVGHRDRPNEILLSDPALFAPEALSAPHYPGGHNEGWPDSLRNMMFHFYSFIREGKDPLQDKGDFATFADGHRSMCITDAVLASHRAGGWVEVHCD